MPSKSSSPSPKSPIYSAGGVLKTLYIIHLHNILKLNYHYLAGFLAHAYVGS